MVEYINDEKNRIIEAIFFFLPIYILAQLEIKQIER